MAVGAVGAAYRRALTLYPRSKALQGAYVAGARARRRGRPLDSCPYWNAAHEAREGFRPAFRVAWLRGWTEAR